jgi:N-terminal half of MaoC dehydratase
MPADPVAGMPPLPSKTFVVDPTKVDEYVHAVGVLPEAGWTPTIGATVPGGFLMYVTTYGAEPVLEATGFDPKRLVFGGSAVETLAPVCLGDRLLLSCALTPIELVGSGEAAFRRATVLVEYIAASGEVVAKERTTLIERGPA